MARGGSNPPFRTNLLPNRGMKSPLQQRAEAAAERFWTARKPVAIEFAGVPKAGKTTTLGQVHAFLKRCGFRVEVVVEHAPICPIRDQETRQFQRLDCLYDAVSNPGEDADPVAAR